jgi:hypothetical protein
LYILVYGLFFKWYCDWMESNLIFLLVSTKQTLLTFCSPMQLVKF